MNKQREKLECTQTSRGQMFLLMGIFSPQHLGHSGQLFAVVADKNSKNRKLTVSVAEATWS